MRKYTTYVGMDVHARSIDASAIDVTTGETRARTFDNCPTAANVAEWLGTLPGPVYSGIARAFRAAGARDCGSTPFFGRARAIREAK